MATAASATPNPVTGTTTAVSVLGADAGGESGLTYTWAATGPAPVTFSANGTNAAKNATATFTLAGTYTLTATITNTGGLTATSPVVVTVNPTLTAIAVAPSTASVMAGQTQPFTATASDQFGVALGTQPAFTWAATGAGTVSTAGLFTGVSAGPATVTASAASVTSPAAAVVVTAATTSTALASSPNPSTVGQNVTFTATVTGVSPTGTVTFTLDGAAQPAATLSGGKATLTTAALTAGPHQVTASYGGDASNSASASTALTQQVNAPPVAHNDAYGAVESQALSVTAVNGVLANDTDPQGGALIASLIAQATHGAVTLNSDGSFAYTPTTGYIGPDAFTYAATDPAGLTSPPATVALSVAQAPATHFQVTAPAAATPGSAFTITVTALNAYGETVTGYGVRRTLPARTARPPCLLIVYLRAGWGRSA